jgi:hypothetical protein
MKKLTQKQMQEVFATRTEHTRLGDCVTVSGSDQKGRVYHIHQSFRETGEGDGWFNGQNHPYTEADKLDRWVSILTDGGGAIVVAEKRLTIVPMFDVKNPYIAQYFR